MRRTVLALVAVFAAAVACSPPAETPAAEPADATPPPPEMPADAPPQEEVDPAVALTPGMTPSGAPVSCLNDIGAEAAGRLVQRCIVVSPATRPPCNVANACEMIQGEIDRSCEMYGPDEAKPAECAA